MSFYRIYDYPLKQARFKHIQFKRDRGGRVEKKADENGLKILEKLEQYKRLDESLSRARRTVRDIILCNHLFNRSRIP